jgi:putative hydrolase of the HAD superfamily
MDIYPLADHPNQVDKVATWYYDEWAQHFPNVTKAMLCENIAKMAIYRDAFPFAIIVINHDELVAVAELKFYENINYPEYKHWLGGVFVAPEKRGNGISNLLITEAKNRAKRLGVKKLYLQCERHNLLLYKKHGFIKLHDAFHHEIATSIMVWVSVE